MNELYDMDKESFEVTRTRQIDLGMYDGTCPFAFKGGACSTFDWEHCSVCEVLHKAKGAV